MILHQSYRLIASQAWAPSGILLDRPLQEGELWESPPPRKLVAKEVSVFVVSEEGKIWA